MSPVSGDGGWMLSEFPFQKGDWCSLWPIGQDKHSAISDDRLVCKDLTLTISCWTPGIPETFGGKICFKPSAVLSYKIKSNTVTVSPIPRLFVGGKTAWERGQVNCYPLWVFTWKVLHLLQCTGHSKSGTRKLHLRSHGSNLDGLEGAALVQPSCECVAKLKCGTMSKSINRS